MSVTLTCDICGSTTDVGKCVTTMKDHCNSCDEAFHIIWNAEKDEWNKAIIAKLESIYEKVRTSRCIVTPTDSNVVTLKPVVD